MVSTLSLRERKKSHFLLLSQFVVFIGNRTRGQADGFGLEILPKLKDVKSAVSILNHYRLYRL